MVTFLHKVTYGEVLQQLKCTRSDSSTGPDKITVKFIKLVADIIASSLTHILNEYIQQNSFPTAWRIARVSPIPKNELLTEADHYQPILVLPVLSKIYEQPVLTQLLEYIQQYNILKDTISGYWKGHSTSTILLRIRDDIIRAIKKREVTLLAFTDFSKLLTLSIIVLS